LFNAGQKKVLGSIEMGTTTTDYLAQERDRGVTIQSAVVSFEHDGQKFNIFDTPGHADFVFEVERSLPAIDSAILILDNCRGVEAQTKAVIRLARRHQLPIIAFGNKMDKFNSNTTGTIESMDVFGLKPLPVQVPLDSNRLYCLLTEKVISNERPTEMTNQDRALIEVAKADLCERVATLSDEILEKYLMNEEIPTNEELMEAVNKAYVDCVATPVLFGASKNNLGVSELVQFQSELAIKRKSALAGKKAALAFKLTNERRLGEIIMLRNFSGTFAGEITIQSIEQEKRAEEHEVLQSLGQYF